VTHQLASLPQDKNRAGLQNIVLPQNVSTVYGKSPKTEGCWLTSVMLSGILSTLEDAGLSLALQGPVQSYQVWCGQV
jgi:hypothetical protein